MARSNGIHSTHADRKQLVQPALPALSLLPKVKKESVKAPEEPEPAENDKAINPQTAAQSEVDSQVVTPVVEEEGNVQDIATPISPALSASVTGELQKEQIGVVQYEAFTSQFEPEATVSGPLTPQHDAAFNDNAVLDVPAVSDLPQTVAEDEDSESDNFEPGDWEPTSTRLPRNPKTLFGNNDAKIEDLDGSSHADLAPEAVTGHVEVPLAAHHAAHASISNSSIQQTPKSAIALIVSPESVRTHRHQESTASAAHAAPEVLANGHSTPSPAELSRGSPGVVSPIAKPNFPTIVDHIRSMINGHDWFDCDICVYYPYSSKPFVYRSAHSLVLIRSERLKNFIYAQRASSYSYYVVNLYPARSMNISAFDAAIKFLYNDNILSVEGLFPLYSLRDKAGKVGALDYFMSYMVAGLELGIEPVVTRSLDLVGRILDWDLAELAVREAIALRASSQPDVYPHAPPDALHVARSILEHVFNLIVLNMDVQHFQVDDDAQPTDLPSRLVQFEGRAAVNPALANMVFGSMPASTSILPDSPNESAPQLAPTPVTIASAIMLNLEYEDLFGLASALKRVHGEQAMRVISDVVGERERRRLNVLNNRSVSNKQRLANGDMWEIIGWREHVYEDNLRRERVSYLGPNKRSGNN